MGSLDIRTVLFTNLAGSVVCTVVVAQLWHHSRRRFDGLSLLVADFVLQAAALGLLSLRGMVTDWVSVVLTNVIIMAGSILGLMGLERFVGKPRSQRWNLVLLGLYTAAFLRFLLVPTDVRIRSGVAAIGLFLIWAQCFWLMVARVDRPLRGATRPVGVVFGLFCALNVGRLGSLLRPSGFSTDFLRSGNAEALVLVGYGALVVVLTVSLVLMVNRRLTNELQAEEAKLTTIFHSSPYAILLTRFTEGTIVEINDGFSRLSGHSHTEAVGKTTTQLGFYHDPEARDDLVRGLRAHGHVREQEMVFVRKDGERFTGVLTADAIRIGDEPFILATVTDISDRKRMEEEIRELSLRDALTGLYNRRGFFTVAEQKIKEAIRERKRLHLIYIDLNGLKAINDTLGHTEGDRALADAARVLRGTFRESDILARVGGDEFVIVSPETAEFGEQACRTRLFGNLEAFNRNEPRPYTLSMSWGATAYDPAAPRPLDDLMAEADQRMYEHKRGARRPTSADAPGGTPWRPAGSASS